VLCHRDLATTAIYAIIDGIGIRAYPEDSWQPQ
jgi:hypothetical protein